MGGFIARLLIALNLPDAVVNWFFIGLGLLLGSLWTAFYLKVRGDSERVKYHWLGFVLGWLICAIPAALGLWGQCTANPELAAIRRFGGKVTVDENAPTRPVVCVDFDNFISDIGWRELGPHLQALPHLRHLRITSIASITDDGLKHLEGLTQLETLEVYSFHISAAGVDELKTKLPKVKIYHTPVRPREVSPPAFNGLGSAQK
jgi:hypothetical protein